MKNAKSHLSAKTFSLFKSLFRTIKNCHSIELAQSLFEELIDEVKKENPTFAKQLENKRENYTAFLKYPEEVRTIILSTNIVEAVNRKIEDAENLSGGYFHSLNNLKLKLGIVVRELHTGRWRKVKGKLAHVSHILKAMFETRFENKLTEIQTQCS